MKLGMMVMGRSLALALEHARQIEAGGFERVWIGEAAVDAFVYATAIAGVTERVGIGTAVALLTRPPAQAVLAAAGVDEFSNGRFVLGLGVGPADRNRDWFGLDPARPVARMREYVAALRAAWQSAPGRPAEVESDLFAVRGFARRFPSPTAALPVYVGVVGPQSTRSAARYANGLIFNVLLPPEYIEGALAGPVTAGLQEAGRGRHDLQIGGVLAVSADPDPAVAVQRAKRQVLTYAGVHYYEPVFSDLGFGKALAEVRSLLAQGQIEAAAAAVPDGLIERVAAAGTADQVRQRLQAWAGHLDFAVVAPPAAFLPPDEAELAFQQTLEALLPLNG